MDICLVTHGEYASLYGTQVWSLSFDTILIL